MLSVSLWFLLYFASIFWLIFGIRILRDLRVVKRTISATDITIIVPFRNEYDQLTTLIKAIQSQTIQPKAWILVNDHSTDASVLLIEELLDDSIPVQLVHLPEGDEGKKMAIRFGLLECETNYFVTMDADVYFDKLYMDSLLNLPDADMVILPVRMGASNGWQQFFSMEFTITSLLNKGVTGWSRPVNASGANLFFDRVIFEDIDDIDLHAHIPSGDDMFALRAFRQAGKKIAIAEGDRLTVTTATPSTVRATVAQRLRWLSKTSDVGDNLNTFLGSWAVLLHLWFFLLLIVTFFGNAGEMTLLLILIKSVIDLSLLRMEWKIWDKKKWIGLILFECFYPIYLIGLMAASMFSQTEWKGR